VTELLVAAMCALNNIYSPISAAVTRSLWGRAIPAWSNALSDKRVLGHADQQMAPRMA
jgi:hypothetical protein